MRDAPNFQLKAARIEAFPIFRPVVRGLEQLLGYSSVPPRRLTALLSLDPSCTAKVLRAANASGFRSRQAKCVEEALDTLGPSSIRSCMSSLIDAAHDQRLEDVAHFDLFHWWAHCTATAFAANQLATISQASNQIEAFTLGMLHEIGVAALYLMAPHQLNEAIELSATESLLIHGCERHCVGEDSRSLGNSIVQSWRLPESLSPVILYHEQPQEAPEEDYALASLLFLANFCAEQAGFGHHWHTKFADKLGDVLARTEFTEEQLGEGVEAAKRGVAAAARALLPQAA